MEVRAIAFEIPCLLVLAGCRGSSRGGSRLEEEVVAAPGVDELAADGTLVGMHPGDVQSQPSDDGEAGQSWRSSSQPTSVADRRDARLDAPVVLANLLIRQEFRRFGGIVQILLHVLVQAALVELARGTLPVPQPGRRRLPSWGVERVVCPHYLKIPASDQPGVFAEVSGVLSRHEISIEAVIQRPQAIRAGARPWVPVVILTNDVSESAVETAVTELAGLSGVTGPISRIRVTDLNALMPPA